jgi:hypothetical protein
LIVVVSDTSPVRALAHLGLLLLLTGLSWEKGEKVCGPPAADGLAYP